MDQKTWEGEAGIFSFGKSLPISLLRQESGWQEKKKTVQFNGEERHGEGPLSPHLAVRKKDAISLERSSMREHKGENEQKQSKGNPGTKQQ